MQICTECSGTIIEYDTAAGTGFCVQCGTVVEESVIVNEINFGETSSGAAVVQGSYVGAGETHARFGGGGRFGPGGGFGRGAGESREQTIANATKKIQSIGNVLRLSEMVCLAATRLYTLAVEHKFTKGRKSLNVVAVCLYVACRQKETKTYMLIDFSDLLQVNVFELGHTYLQLVQTLNLRLPLVDPSHYISRFASLLEFGEETHKVATDAVRLVQRFDRDWMTRGRRPAGICGAALLLAARMNHFRRSVEEIVQVVKIADSTLKKRLEEFRRTPSGALTLADFRAVWLEEEMDPPAFVKGREKEEKERKERERAASGEAAAENEAESASTKKKGKKKGKRKRAEDDVDEHEGEAAAPEQPQATSSSMGQPPPQVPMFDPTSILGSGILADTDMSNIDPVLLAADGATMGVAIDGMSIPFSTSMPGSIPMLDSIPILGSIPSSSSITMPSSIPSSNSIPPTALPSSTSPTTTLSSTTPASPAQEQPNSTPPLFLPDVDADGQDDADPLDTVLTQKDQVEDQVDTVLTEEVETFLALPQGAMLSRALDEAEERRVEERAREGVDELAGLDEEELDQFILCEEEVRVKERVWVELNREYLEALLEKTEREAGVGGSGAAGGKGRKRRKTNNNSGKPRDASNAAGGTAAESVRNLLKKNPKYSKRINYNALKDLFVDGAGSSGGPTSSGLGFGASSNSRSGGVGVLGFGGGNMDSDDKENEKELYVLDDKDEGDGEMQVIVEEGPPASLSETPRVVDNDNDNENADGEEDEDEEADADAGWDEPWEQEL